jgi:hypothetical protein
MKEVLKKFINDKFSKESKAEKSILQSILGIISDLNLKDDFVITWIDDAINDKIFKNLDFINGGNWHKSLVNKEYLPFMIELFECRPVGLGTPNAMCGEGELMLILSSPKIKKPKQNDIQIGLNVYDIKNDLPRIFGENTGKKLNEKLLKLCLDLDLVTKLLNSMNWDDLGFKVGGRLCFTQKSLQNVGLPNEFEKIFEEKI